MLSLPSFPLLLKKTVGTAGRESKTKTMEKEIVWVHKGKKEEQIKEVKIFYTTVSNNYNIECLLYPTGAVIVFTGLLSVGFLGRRLRYFHWLGIAFVLIGLVVVGLSDFISSSETNQDLNGVITGEWQESFLTNPQRINPMRWLSMYSKVTVCLTHLLMI